MLASGLIVHDLTQNSYPIKSRCFNPSNVLVRCLWSCSGKNRLEHKISVFGTELSNEICEVNGETYA